MSSPNRQVAPPIFVGKSLDFVINGGVPVDQTFSEPTVQIQSATNTDGTASSNGGSVTLQPSVLGAIQTDGTQPFTTKGTYVGSPAPCTVIIEADVLGKDDGEFSVQVLPIPPETVAFDPNGFVAHL